jgi:hypothetical protein
VRDLGALVSRPGSLFLFRAVHVAGAVNYWDAEHPRRITASFLQIPASQASRGNRGPVPLAPSRLALADWLPPLCLSIAKSGRAHAAGVWLA